MFTSDALGSLVNALDCSPFGAASGRATHHRRQAGLTQRAKQRRPLYTPEERVRRDATVWTLVQGVLAPVQFLVFLVSLALVARYLLTGEGLLAAEISIVAKTMVLYTIMVTGAIWEREVFGRYLFAPAFYWEDMVSMLVLALHTTYLAGLYQGWDANLLMLVALSAYGTYVVNAMQFVMKLRAARLDMARQTAITGQPAGVAR